MPTLGHKVAIITDSTSDLTPEQAARHGILVAPMRIILGAQEYTDQVDITHQQFYEWIARGRTLPRTAQPTLQDFLSLVEQARQAGAEEAVAILISDRMSGTLNAVAQAAQDARFPIHVVNSKSVSMGLGWQVLAAARARAAGADAAGIIAAVEAAREHMVVMFVVDTLEYLHRGGRIGGAAKLVGMALGIKPSLVVDHTQGRIEAGEKTRTMKKAVDRMLQTVFSQLDATRPLHVAVQHCNAPEPAEKLAERIQSDYRPSELTVGHASLAVGTHGGPGTFGICAYTGS